MAEGLIGSDEAQLTAKRVHVRTFLSWGFDLYPARSGGQVPLFFSVFQDVRADFFWSLSGPKNIALSHLLSC